MISYCNITSWHKRFNLNKKHCYNSTRQPVNLLDQLGSHTISNNFLRFSPEKQNAKKKGTLNCNLQPNDFLGEKLFWLPSYYRIMLNYIRQYYILWKVILQQRRRILLPQDFIHINRNMLLLLLLLLFRYIDFNIIISLIFRLKSLPKGFFEIVEKRKFYYFFLSI